MDKLRNISSFDLQTLLDNNKSVKGILLSFGINSQSGYYSSYLYERIKKEKLSTEMMLKNAKLRHYLKKPLKSILANEVTYPKGCVLKKRLIEEGLKIDKCEICGLLPLWNGTKLNLQLDHINGNHSDNSLENLRIVCPNCHTQTHTFGAKNIKTKKQFLVERQPQHKNTRRKNTKLEISKEELHEMVNVKKMPYTTIGKLYGVSDNAIRKKCQKLGVNIRKIKNII